MSSDSLSLPRRSEALAHISPYFVISKGCFSFLIFPFPSLYSLPPSLLSSLFSSFFSSHFIFALLFFLFSSLPPSLPSSLSTFLPLYLPPSLPLSPLRLPSLGQQRSNKAGWVTLAKHSLPLLTTSLHMWVLLEGNNKIWGYQVHWCVMYISTQAYWAVIWTKSKCSSLTQGKGEMMKYKCVGEMVRMVWLGLKHDYYCQQTETTKKKGFLSNSNDII